MPVQPRSYRPHLLHSCHLLVIILIFINSCQSPSRDDKAQLLANQYCGSCHLPVSPALLDSATWTDHVLPAMAKRLKVKVWGEKEYYPPMAGDEASLVPFKDWLEIVAWYQRTAPKKLAPAKRDVPIQEGWAGFSLVHPNILDTNIIAASTLVAFSEEGYIYNSNAYTNELSCWNLKMEKLSVWKTTSPVVDISFRKNEAGNKIARITQIGDMRAVDKPSGIISEINTDLKESNLTDIKPYLQRPVQTLYGDFNKDGQEDMISCSFGHNTGGLYFLRKSGGKYEEIPMLQQPGAIHAVAGDFNNDGWQDVMALFAAGEEGIWLFENDRKGGFKPINLLKFPPIYGSTSFQLYDFNGDGKLDILYTCGDNADYSMVLKPYHGVYIFLNEGNNQYKQAWFYPVNGCTKAFAADFNGDGRPDIATIAFFADLQHNPKEKFLFFQGGNKPLQFTPFAPPIEKEGHWMTMDVADVDKDGDLDIILGNYAKGFIIQSEYQPNWKEYQPFIVLLNTLYTH